MEKVRKYDREWKKNLHYGMDFTSWKGKEKASPSPTKKVTSHFDQSSTPVKKPPSYYKVLAASKKGSRFARTKPQNSYNNTQTSIKQSYLIATRQ